MDNNVFSKQITEMMNKINVKINENQINQFYKYMNLLLEWNKKINLTAITDEKEIILKHFVDCATLIKYIDENELVIDVGTGAGFPGIPIKILNNNINVTLVDSLNKRINFLNNVIEELSLKNIETIHSRVEDLGQNEKYREKYDVVVSRAVAPLNILLEYTLPFVKKNGKAICMKGSNIQEEVDNSKNALELLGGYIERVDKFDLLKTNNSRSIIIIKKIKNSPKKYPRKAGKPSKEPIM